MRVSRAWSVARIAFALVAGGVVANRPALAHGQLGPMSPRPPGAPLPPAPPPGWQPLEYVGPRPVPQYPGLAYLEGFSGTVIVRATVQPDGRVADTQVDTSSGHLALDEAALRAVRQSQFNAINGASLTRNRIARIPFHFSAGRQQDVRVVLLGAAGATQAKQNEPALEWPSAYVHPRYEQAATPMQFRDALDTVRELAHAAPPVSGGPQMYAEFVEKAASGDVPKAIWFALDPGKPYGMIVRYTFAGAPAQPVVNVAAACPNDSAACAEAVPALLMGPFFAPAASAQVRATQAR